MLGNCYEIKKFRLNNIILDSLEHLNKTVFQDVCVLIIRYAEESLVMQTINVFFML